jgi:hypothetical protein
MRLRSRLGLATCAFAPALSIGLGLALGWADLLPGGEATTLTVHWPWSDLVTLLWAPVFLLPWIFQ